MNAIPAPSLANNETHQENSHQHGHEEEYNTASRDEQDENSKIWRTKDGDAALQNGHVQDEEAIDVDHSDAPPSKRRKLAEVPNGHKRTPSRAKSPPWKSVVAEGPTTFQENGKRRSGRTNAVPLELQPSNGKRQTRGAHTKVEKQVKPVYNDVKKSRPQTPKHVKTPSVDSPSLRRVSTRPTTATSAKKEIQSSVKSPPQSQTKDETPPRKKTAMPKTKTALLREIAKVKKQLKQEKALLEDYSSEADGSDKSEALYIDPEIPLWLKKVTFKPLKLPQTTIMTPANRPLVSKYANFQEYLDNDVIEDPTVRQPLSDYQIRLEAIRRIRVKSYSYRGGSSHINLPPRQPEPKREYVHYDFLIGHAKNFHHLLFEEKKRHVNKAKEIAEEAVKYLTERNSAKEAQRRAATHVKTPEEIEKEIRDAWIMKYRDVAKDLQRLWQAVDAEVNAARLMQWEQAEQDRVKAKLNHVLDRTDAMLFGQEEEESDSEDMRDSNVSDSADEGGHISDNSEQMSESGSESGSEGRASVQNDGNDAEMTVEELKAKYGNMPDLDLSRIPSPEVDGVEVGEESDESTVMDSELDSDEEDEEDDDDEDEDEVELDGSGGGLRSLFSKQELEELKSAPAEDDADTPIDHEDDEGDDSDAALPHRTEDHDMNVSQTPLTPPESHADNTVLEEVPDKTNLDSDQDMVIVEDQDNVLPPIQLVKHQQQPVDHATPPLSVDKSVNDDALKDSGTDTEDADMVEQNDENASLTPVSPLLRGTLRKYQHEGLDWLAKLYKGGRSGILADEMGLGKTIQSISLLAHLATTYEVWGPHLIVVPTSVMLNWEMEFKKFLPGFKILTYYGDQKARQIKRKGWLNDDMYNVVITSYQLVLQDQNMFRRRKWHYMILDEAHNIKNFQSARWQTMMTFNTRARLLLTGTPLQNNLTELWALLFFLHYGQQIQNGEDSAFADLQQFQQWFARQEKSILQDNKQKLDGDDYVQIQKLHKLIRPYLLRRLKCNVEKQMPLKYEHVEYCRLSKRQRQLYDGFMSRAQTQETLASGNYLSIINALMQLRKVCNHPDLFETRPINTSFAMPRSVAAEFEIKDLLVRRQLVNSDMFSQCDLRFLELAPISRETLTKRQALAFAKINAYKTFEELRERQRARVKNRSKLFTANDRDEIQLSLENIARQDRLQHIDRTIYHNAYKHHQRPLFGADALKKLDFPLRCKVLAQSSLFQNRSRFWENESALRAFNLVESVETRSMNMKPLIEQFACITPAATATDLPVTVIGESRVDTIRKQQAGQRYDPFHQARMKLSIGFPDKRLLQYDCGKLQRLDKLLRQLQSGGHRALIFTQMTKVLDILEQFLNIHGHRYLRLDGATKVEERQSLTERFNNDTRILCFILSSRSGGLGINLTGADTVIFYDLDWNPAMDRQCTDRAHRIGQTRDVHIYRFVSEHTIEANILRKANQKSILDEVVIQDGDFTTEKIAQLSKTTPDESIADEDDVAGAAMDRVLGNTKDAKSNVKVFEEAEDRDDVAAARVAEKEVENIDEADFNEHANGVDDPTKIAADADNKDEDGIRHVDDYLLRTMWELVKYVPLIVPNDKKKKRKRSGRDGRTRR